MCLQRDYANELHRRLERNLISCAHQNKSFSDSLKSSLPPSLHQILKYPVSGLKETREPKANLYSQQTSNQSVLERSFMLTNMNTSQPHVSLMYHPAKTPQCEPVVTELAMEKFLLVSSKQNTIQIPAHL